MQVLERYKSQNLQRVCNFEVNKGQIKNGIPFWFSCNFILLKNRHHQNTTNRMCIKHWNLECFLSMSLNAFNTTLGKWYIPFLSGGPWGGLPYIYINNSFFKYLHVFTCSVYTHRNRRRIDSSSVWVIGSSLDWLIDWLIDGLVDCLIDWLIDWLVGWLIDWLIVFLVS